MQNIALAIIINIFSVAAVSLSDTYQVAFRHMPNTLSPIENQRIGGSFLLWQLVHPLFSFNSAKILESKVLNLSKTSAITEDFDKFKFCLKPNLTFSSGKSVTEKNLIDTFLRLNKYVEGFGHIKKIEKTETGCVNIQLGKRDLHFFEKLTGVASSIYIFDPAKPLAIDSVGDFKIEKVENNTIILKSRSSNSFKKVYYSSIIYKLYERSDVWEETDLNFVSGDIAPPNEKSNFIKVHPPSKKVYSIIINLDDPNRRKCFASLINTITLAKVLKINVEKIKGFIPSEMLGSNQALILDKKLGTYCKKNFEFTWHDFRVDDQVEIKNYFNNLANQHKVKIKVVFHKLEELIKLSESKKEYITAISFNSSGSKDAWNSDSSVFFEPFIRSPSIINHKINNLEALVKEAATTDTIYEKSLHLEKAHRALLDSHYVLPIGESKKSHYYPSSISQIQWADKVSGIPLISGLE